MEDFDPSTATSALDDVVANEPAALVFAVPAVAPPTAASSSSLSRWRRRRAAACNSGSMGGGASSDPNKCRARLSDVLADCAAYLLLLIAVLSTAVLLLAVLSTAVLMLVMLVQGNVTQSRCTK